MSEPPKPYPLSWENRADLRVFRTTAAEWQKLISWRSEMRRRGWRLLKVTHEGEEMIAVFGRTKQRGASDSAEESA